MGSAFLITLLLSGMGTISFQFGTSNADLLVTALLFVYVAILNVALLRSTVSPSTRPPSPSKRAVRLLFPLTALISILLPIALMVMCPALGPSGVARHTWLVFAQLLFESIAHMLSSRVRVAVLPRLAGTAAFIAYRIPVARSWAMAPQVPGVASRTQDIASVVATANAVYWALGLFWFLVGVCVPYHVTEPKDANVAEKTE